VYSIEHRKLRNSIIIGLFIIYLIGLTFAGDQFVKILDVLDDPSAFTGRTQIWPVLVNYAADHPLLGAGYGSFFSIGSDSPLFNYASDSISGFFKHAHNGYLQVLVEIGGVGLAFTIIGLVVNPLYTLFCKPLQPNVSRFFICSILIFCFLHD